MRITGQLIDPRTDAHLWAESYNREEDLAEIFAIQSDVAQKIAAALKATLTSEEKSYIKEKPTDNPEAYDYYLKGNAHIYRHRQVPSSKYVENAIAMYEKAVELDPDFTLAWARLARAHMYRYFPWQPDYDQTPERLARAKSALDRALALAPDHPEVHLAHGWYYYRGFGDWEKALEQAELGLKGQPGNAEIFRLIGLIKRRQGKWEEAADAFSKAAELDPRQIDNFVDMAATCLLMRNWAAAERYADQVTLMWPDIIDGYRQKARVNLWSKGDIEKARGVMEAAQERVDPGQLVGWRSYIEILARDYRKALDIVEAVTADWFLRKADIYRYLGRPEQAVAHYDSARVEQEELVRIDPDDYAAHGNLGIAYAGLSRREDAIREGKLAVEIMPLSRDALEGTYWMSNLAIIYAMLGEQDAAIDHLDILLSIPSGITVPILKLNPLWDPLREHQRFQGLLEKAGLE